MRKLVYHVAITADGCIAREDHSFDFFVMEGDHAADYLTSLAGYGAVVMGRRTYDVGLKVGVTDPYPTLETYVFSRTLKESPNPRVKIIAEDAVGAIRKLKAQEGKPMYLAGGGDFAAMLLAEGLVDEVLFKLNPVLLGGGIPVVSRLAAPVNLDLVSTKVYRNGVVLLQYEVRPSGKAAGSA
ncbi:dihydrofolate reductase family protein [Polyangium sorediatum]|uniref:Dihydrofolate reductase family protein n=1 Tax=Polyangium sorediatum TaxID=889274 RepID=A0ABT6NUL9_9BACT|nr:dihydrofolate reductase family protein [Polyangium sorediatum]MDI1432040.1 dihydrofolate reductase family protein [Polyangium sorediatum]